MLNTKTFRLSLIWGCCALFSPGAVVAQTNLEVNAGIQFNFSTPGATNLAMGGAFLALADDATTAYTNPAGLTNIGNPEVHLEARRWTYTHLFTDRGRLEGYPISGDDFDTIEGLQDGEADDQVTGLSFLSYVYPRGRWAIAFYRHELANFEANFNSQGAYLKPSRARSPLGIPGQEDGRLASLRNTVDLEIVNFGISTAYSVNWRFSVGVGISYYDFSFNSISERFLPGLSKRMNFDDPTIKPVTIQTQDGEDWDWGISGGFFWQSDNTVWSIGGAYRRGPHFDFKTENKPGDGKLLDFDPFEEHPTFHVPAFFGLGVSWRPADAIRVAFDYNHIEYSALTRNFKDIFGLRERFKLDDPQEEHFVVDDVDEFHLGLSYRPSRLNILFLRLGAWYEADHSLRFEGANEAYRAIFRGRGDQIHYAAGIGIYPKRFGVDAAFDYSDRISTVSLSSVFHF